MMDMNRTPKTGSVRSNMFLCDKSNRKHALSKCFVDDHSGVRMECHQTLTACGLAQVRGGLYMLPLQIIAPEALIWTAAICCYCSRRHSLVLALALKVLLVEIGARLISYCSQLSTKLVPQQTCLISALSRLLMKGLFAKNSDTTSPY